MRIQHATQTASGLPTDDAGRMQAKIVIVEEVDRLRWRIWNGKAKNAKRSIDRVRKVMHAYKEERGHTMRTAPSHRLWHALLDVDGYLRGQSNWLVNYAKRYRADLRVGTSITEGTANFLVNRRIKKSQQMRWSEEVPISCPRFAARSTMGRSARGSVTGFSRMPTRTSGRSTRLDPPFSGHVHESVPDVSFSIGIATRQTGENFADLARKCRHRDARGEAGGGYLRVSLIQPM